MPPCLSLVGLEVHETVIGVAVVQQVALADAPATTHHNELGRLRRGLAQPLELLLSVDHSVSLAKP